MSVGRGERSLLQSRFCRGRMFMQVGGVLSSRAGQGMATMSCSRYQMKWDGSHCGKILESHGMAWHGERRAVGCGDGRRVRYLGTKIGIMYSIRLLLIASHQLNGAHGLQQRNRDGGGRRQQCHTTTTTGRQAHLGHCCHAGSNKGPCKKGPHGPSHAVDESF